MLVEHSVCVCVYVCEPSLLSGSQQEFTLSDL